MREIWTVQLGLLAYREAYALQERLRGARQAGAIADTLLLVQHPPVYTRGRRSAPGELALGAGFYAQQGIDVVDVERGGKVTYHGPGQLVAYPIVAVTDVPGFVAAMEAAVVDALTAHGLPGARGRSHEGPRLTGVWIGERKIASIGVHVSRGVSIHGLALNVDNDLAPFGWIVPCGLPDVEMTSVARELGSGGQLPCLRRRVAFALAQALDARQRLLSRQRLEAALHDAAVTA